MRRGRCLDRRYDPTPEPASASMERLLLGRDEIRSADIGGGNGDAGAKGLGPKPSGSVLQKMVAGPSPLVGFW